MPNPVLSGLLNGPITVNEPYYVGSEPALGVVNSNDTTPFTQTCRGLIAVGAGTCSCAFVDGSSDSVFLASGIALPVVVNQVFHTGTSATGVHGLH